MSRTRAERRHNTQVKTSSRKALPICSLRITPSGEACTCNLCNGSMHYDRNYYRSLNDIRLAAWYKSHE